MVRLFDYMAGTPARSPGEALAAAAGDCDRRGGDTIELPSEVIGVDQTITLPATVGLFIPRGGGINATGTLTVLGRITSEATDPFAGTIRTGA